MLSDTNLSLKKYAMKMGLFLVFILLDLVLYPSVVQFFVPISMSFFVLCGVGILILVCLERAVLIRCINSK
jgi:hypothetical protein